MATYKITVVRRMLNQDLIDQYANSRITSACTRFADGQEFVCTDLNMPPGFCHWAWADIQRDAMIISMGGNMPWVKQPGVQIAACSDGFRPVIFKIERVE